MLEVEPTGQRDRTTGNDWNGAVAGAASEEFARWLHHRYVSVELLSAGTSFRCTRDILFCYQIRQTRVKTFYTLPLSPWPSRGGCKYPATQLSVSGNLQ